nr:unnamed protein product [Callosobruchus chinensis]
MKKASSKFQIAKKLLNILILMTIYSLNISPKLPIQNSEPVVRISNNLCLEYQKSINEFILNLKRLNRFIDVSHSKLEDHRTVPKFKRCNFLLSIKKNHRNFLRFKFDNKLYKFTCLPFGLNVAPYIFTKLLKPVAKKVRLEGMLTVFYLDDIVIIGKDKLECMKNTKITLTLLEILGFLVNLEKSSLHPQQAITFLGFNYDTVNMHISLPIEKKQAIKKLIGKFKKKNKTFTDKRIFNVNCYNEKLVIPEELLAELEWWYKNIGIGQDIKP